MLSSEVDTYSPTTLRSLNAMCKCHGDPLLGSTERKETQGEDGETDEFKDPNGTPGARRDAIDDVNDVFYNAVEYQDLETTIDNLLGLFEGLLLYLTSMQALDDQLLKVVILHLQATMPVSAHADDAGYDVTMPATIILKLEETMKVPLGIAVEAPPGFWINWLPSADQRNFVMESGCRASK
ncbi:hypothetical protein H4R24_004695 [Coemansia sp. RSA 988]|nr:hypothetical protein H4R24_004695 [Coemansia sp. RSA 988]